jgi:hypothetical protein
MYLHKCKIINIINSNTIEIRIDHWVKFWIPNKRIKLENIDIPQDMCSDKIESAFGLYSKKFLESTLPINSIQTVQISDNPMGIYGDFISDNGDYLTDIMVQKGLGVDIKNQSKNSIVLNHLLNRKRLIQEGKINIYNR